MVWSTHSVHYVVEEKLAVSRDHHDLQFVREALGDDFVDQQRILLQNRGLARHTLGVGGGGQTNALGLGLRQKFAALPLVFAVDDFSFAGSFGILHRKQSRGGAPQTSGASRGRAHSFDRLRRRRAYGERGRDSEAESAADQQNR